METHVCPWWLGYALASPLRKLIQDPHKILRPYVKENMTVLDFGCAMGYFSLPIAEMVGAKGKVVCVDLQEKMLNVLDKKVKKYNFKERMELRHSSQNDLRISDLQEKIDFALIFAVIHEMPEQKEFLKEAFKALKNNGKLLISDPLMHVTQECFDKTIREALEVGFIVVEHPEIKKSMSVLLEKI